MLSYCLHCRKNTESKNQRLQRQKNGRIMVSSNCAVYGSKKSKFIKEQEGKSLLNMISKIPFTG